MDPSSAHCPGPRERLREVGLAALSHEELVALILRTGSRGRSATALAGQLLRERGGLLPLARSQPGELNGFPGIGAAKASALSAAFELGRRAATRALAPGSTIRSAADVDRHFRPRLRGARREHFLVLLLDTRNRFLREVAVSIGTLTASLVHPREVFRPALREAAAALVLVHNHPSGDPQPSSEDREITRRLVGAGALLGVPIVDHVVIAERGYTSLREEGMFPEGDSPGESSSDAEAFPVAHVSGNAGPWVGEG